MKKKLNENNNFFFFFRKYFLCAKIMTLFNNIFFLTTILTMSLLPFWALNMVVVLLSMQGQKALGFHQNYLNLCFRDEWRSYGFGTTWGWVINDIIFIFGWTIHLILRTLHLCDIKSRKLREIVSILRNEVTIVRMCKNCLEKQSCISEK